MHLGVEQKVTSSIQPSSTTLHSLVYHAARASHRQSPLCLKIAQIATPPAGILNNEFMGPAEDEYACSVMSTTDNIQRL